MRRRRLHLPAEQLRRAWINPTDVSVVAAWPARPAGHRVGRRDHRHRAGRASSCGSPATSPAPSTSRSTTSASRSLTGAATVILSGHLDRLRVGGLHRAGDRRRGVRRVPAAPGSVIVSLFAVALAGTGLLTTVGVIVAMDTFGPVSDNAQGIAEMSGDVKGAGRGHPHRARRGRATPPRRSPRASRSRRPCSPRPRCSAPTATRSAPRCDRGRRPLDQTGRVQLRGVQPEHPGRRDHRRRGRVHVLRSGDQRRHPGRGRDRVRGAPPVPRPPRDHGRHGAPGVRPRRRHLHPRLAARAGHPRPAGDPRADRGRLRPRRRPAGRATWPAPSPPAP